MKLLILSDIHGNLSALDSVLSDVTPEQMDGVILLGDMIDYGPRSNEVVAKLASMDTTIVKAIWGNHEKAVLEKDFSLFSSKRGEDCARNTAEALSTETRRWLFSECDSSGCAEFDFGGFSCLAVHGSLDNPYWKSIEPSKVDVEPYCGYDIVFSGHNHVPHAFSLFCRVDDAAMRDKRKVMFVNPGSVGQPRNHDPRAQYAIFDSDSGVSLLAVEYDIQLEQSLFDNTVDSFYRERLSRGI